MIAGRAMNEYNPGQSSIKPSVLEVDRQASKSIASNTLTKRVIAAATRVTFIGLNFDFLRILENRSLFDRLGIDVAISIFPR